MFQSILEPDFEAELAEPETVPAAKKRVYDKRHCCLFCNKYYAKMARHLEQCHKDEAEVALILSHPKKIKNEEAKVFRNYEKRGLSPQQRSLG